MILGFLSFEHGIRKLLLLLILFYLFLFQVMGSSNIRDILTAFSPSLDYFALSSGDGRIKVTKIIPSSEFFS